MKKVCIFVLLLLFGISLIAAAECGDVNSDGSVDIVDALLIAQYYVGLNPSNFDSTVADVNCDGEENIVDALLIAQLYVGLISQLDCCETETSTPTPTPDTTPAPTAESFNEVVFAVNCGGSAYTASDGTEFAADTGYSGGTAYDNGVSVSGTSDPTLYSTERYGSCTYSASVPNGECRVTLYFAENYHTSSGSRSFNVLMEGTQVISNLDIYAEAGANTAYVTENQVTVSDGEINIEFATVTENALINAIKVDVTVIGTPLPTPVPTPVPTPEPTSSGSTVTIGRFHVGTDLLISHHDNGCDLDDSNSVAAEGTFLTSSSDYQSINCYLINGTFKKGDSGHYDMSSVINIAYPNKWSNADNDWNGAVNKEASLIENTLNNGGDVWIAEGGGSDFTSDVLDKVKSDSSSYNTESRVHVVQTSTYNQNTVTTASRLQNVKNKSNYILIPSDYGTWTTRDTSIWNAPLNSRVRNLWQAEKNLLDQRKNNMCYDNPDIIAGGMSLEDTEAMDYIFQWNFTSISGFLQRFL